MKNKKLNNTVVKSLILVLLISALVLSQNVYSNATDLAEKDKVGGEIVKANIIEVAEKDKVGGEIVKSDTVQNLYLA